MFRYSDAQWDNIQVTIQHLPKFAEAFVDLRAGFDSCADYYLGGMKVDGPRKKKWNIERRRWAACEKSLEKTASLIRAGMDAEFDQASCPRPQGLMDIELSLIKLNSFVRSRTDGPPPPLGGASFFRRGLHVRILGIWTALGGELRFSRNPNVVGPLARYFTAVTLPLHKGSLETLPDIVKRQQQMEANGFKSMTFGKVALALARAMKHLHESNGGGH